MIQIHEMPIKHLTDFVSIQLSIDKFSVSEYFSLIKLFFLSQPHLSWFCARRRNLCFWTESGWVNASPSLTDVSHASHGPEKQTHTMWVIVQQQTVIRTNNWFSSCATVLPCCVWELSACHFQPCNIIKKDYQLGFFSVSAAKISIYLKKQIASNSKKNMYYDERANNNIIIIYI